MVKLYFVSLYIRFGKQYLCAAGPYEVNGGPRDVMWPYKKEFYWVASSTMGYCRVLQNICMYRITYTKVPLRPPPPATTMVAPMPRQNGRIPNWTGLGHWSPTLPPHGRGALGICLFDDLCNFNFLQFPLCVLPKNGQVFVFGLQLVWFWAS